MTRLFTLALVLLFSFNSFSQTFKVDTIYKHGSIDNRVNVVILGDGFTQAELPNFTEEARKFADFFLNYAPYNAYRNYFNFFSIATPSKESGVSNPGNAPDAYPDQPVGKKDTYYGASFGEYIHRLVVVQNYQRLTDVLAYNMPTADLVVMLVNTPFYGGSGGGIAVHTLHTTANTIGVHEIGHTFSALNDEYWAGPQYGWEAANMTAISDPATVKWKNWLNETNIGVFPHGEGEAAKWFKPTHANCLMEYLDRPFCAVCKEATAERILQIVSPIDRSFPENTREIVLQGDPTTFRLELVEPEPSSLKVEWFLDKKLIKTGNEIRLNAADMQEAEGTLLASVFDTTLLSRREKMEDQRTKAVQWTLVKSNSPQAFELKVSDASICPGEFSVITASGCRGDITWSTSETGISINVKPEKTTSYSATCKTTGQPNLTASAQITVFEQPKASATNTGPYFEKATIEIAASGGISYFWNGPGGYLSQVQVSLIENATVANAGTYEVKVVDINGCTAFATTEVRVDPILAVENPSDEILQVSPNPAKGFVKIKTKLGGRSLFTLFDINGRKVLDKHFENQTELNVQKSAGLYLYRFSNGGREVAGKLLIE
ncbi:M64 family metallo-endopeptidase [Dyadobacter chenwenxiniae]|uniref:M64 family metallo-endopeptidase n=1 Tax=Dyadobacter chenwenxiniae TaxID=2906456 RepID=A0A9X1PQC6_9BACT|nr:M64 family metallopeptidase [Dyadobacter chenwenxiniae]MCF0062931.1 M64 family metallo-endopeptidase [Dyadobacter chenwenxiniae]UON84895.1 M64 family metallo-endopeptidase [Dyadobacter chenwenxiniae]